MNKTLIILLAILFLCCLCAVVLGGAYYFLVYRPAQNELLIRPLVINAGDIPSGWPDDHYGSSPTVDGADAAINLVYDYYYPGDARAYNWLSHEVILYSDEQSAAEGFKAYKEHWLAPHPGDVKVQITFRPRNSQDPFDTNCSDASEPGHSITICYFLQQHGRILSFFFAKFDGKVLTVEQVSTTLTRLDARLP